MSAKSPDFPDQSAPRSPGPADLGKPMTHDKNGLRDQSPDLQSPQAADDALLRWDELDEQLLRLLAEDPERGRRLRKLQDADGWLRARATEAARKASGPALLLCPPAEDLYDFGQGPGASSLSLARREAIDRHMATCLDCERFVATLAAPPPSPLILGLPAESDQEDEAPAPEIEPIPLPVRPARRLRLWPAVTAAAALVALVVIVQERTTPASSHFPTAVLLRGSAGGPVLFPREHVLMASAQVRALFPALASPLEFEVEPQEGADQYRFDVFRHEGGAFGRDVALERLPSAEPRVTARQSRELGRFTFKAWATVRGLDQRLGARDFEVVADAALDQKLQALSNRSEPDRTLAAVGLLHEAGFVTDARALARTMPMSAERDRYLGQSPGR